MGKHLKGFYSVPNNFLDKSCLGVSMDVMLNFNRLKCLSDDKDAICTALRKSSTGLIEVCRWLKEKTATYFLVYSLLLL